MAWGSDAGFAEPDVTLHPASTTERHALPRQAMPGRDGPAPASSRHHTERTHIRRCLLDPAPTHSARGKMLPSSPPNLNQPCSTAREGQSYGYSAAGIRPLPNVHESGFACPGLPASPWVGTGCPSIINLSPTGNAPTEERWRHGRVHGQLQGVAAGWICTVQGVQPTPTRDTIRARENQRPGAGKHPRGLPRQSAPHGSAAAPPRRQRGSSLNYLPCPGKAAGTGQRCAHLFGVWREHPSCQPQRQGPRRAGSRPSHRYFHSLTSVLLPAGGLFSKNNRSCSRVSAKGWAVPHPSHLSPGRTQGRADKAQYGDKDAKSPQGPSDRHPWRRGMLSDRPQMHFEAVTSTKE